MSHKIIPSVNVIIIEGNKILVGRRQNTGWMDDLLCIPGGHIEKDETPREAAVRELNEELDLDIKVDDLEFLCVLARNKEPDSYVGYEFTLKKAPKLNISNAEPEKCSELIWIDIHNLPDDLIDFCRDVIQQSIIGDKKYFELTY